MKGKKRNRPIRTPQLEDVPELIHHLQSKLPVNEAARTCVLSRSWLHAWSTIPTLRFSASQEFVSKEQKEKQLKVVDCTLNRYFVGNIPIEKIDLQIDIVNQESASVAERCIPRVASKSCLKELCLRICSNYYPFTFPDEIFYSENLNKVRVASGFNPNTISNNPVINCISLRVLELLYVHVSEEVLNNLLATCSLLEKIKFSFPRGGKTIKVKNLHFLQDLEISSSDINSSLEISDVPSLNFLFYYYSTIAYHQNMSLPFNTDSLQHVTQLHLGGLTIENEFFDLIRSKFLFLESLTLEMQEHIEKSMDISSLSLKRLTLISLGTRLINVQVHAPKLHLFYYDGQWLPNLLFPSISPEKIEISFKISNPCIDNFFFPKLREILNLSSRFDLEIVMSSYGIVALKIDIDDLKKTLSLPAMNIRQLSLKTLWDKGLREHSPVFDALFFICHPKYVKAYPDADDRSRNYFSMIMIREMTEWVNRKGCWRDLKDVEIKNHHDDKWEKLTSSWRSFLDGSTDVDQCPVEFKLNWCSS